jgi:hypothetical protein
MAHVRPRPSRGWLVLALILIGVNLAAIRAAILPHWDWRPGKGASISVEYRHDGSVAKYIHPYSGGKIGPIELESPSALGLWRIWWPVATSAGASLLIPGIAWLSSRDRHGRAMRRPPMTMIHVMLIVGLASFGLWLIRFEVSLIISGLVVVVLTLLAAHRRSDLSEEATAETMFRPALSSVGIVGYSLAILLGLAWVVSILVWDAYLHGRH